MNQEPHLYPHKFDRQPTDADIAALAAEQHGPFATWQTPQLGRGAVVHRVRTGRWHRIHNGVFALTPPSLLSRTGRVMAALLSAGPNGVLSHRTAAWAWAMTRRLGSAIHVTVLGATSGRERGGVRIHPGTRVDPCCDLAHTEDGLRVTEPHRTLLDFAPQAVGGELDNAIDHAEANLGYDHRHMAALLASHRGKPGTPALRSALEGVRLAQLHANSDGEKALYRMIVASISPKPAMNVVLLGESRDYWWPDHNLAVEYDGWDGHKSRAQQDADHQRDADLLAPLSIATLRFTGIRVTREPQTVIDSIRRALAWSQSRNAARAAQN